MNRSIFAVVLVSLLFNLSLTELIVAGSQSKDQQQEQSYSPANQYGEYNLDDEKNNGYSNIQSEVRSGSQGQFDILRVKETAPALEQEQLKRNFTIFQQQFNKNYNQEEQTYRFETFKQKLNEIQLQNTEGQTFQKGINDFSDLSRKQFQSIYLMSDQVKENDLSVEVPKEDDDTVTDFYLSKIQPIDWGLKIKIGPIKAQAGCPACYAFAVISAIELNYALKYDQKVPNLSEQQIIDCCKPPEFICNRCRGGQLISTFKYLAKNGIAYTEHYPYGTKQTASCKTSFPTKKYLIKNTPYKTMKGVRQAIYLLNNGPLAANVDGTYWDTYKSGVFNHCTAQVRYNHAIVIIGVEADGTWLLRNSWGTWWGMSGYMRLLAGNSCGVADMIYLPLII